MVMNTGVRKYQVYNSDILCFGGMTFRFIFPEFAGLAEIFALFQGDSGGPLMIKKGSKIEVIGKAVFIF